MVRITQRAIMGLPSCASLYLNKTSPSVALPTVLIQGKLQFFYGHGGYVVNKHRSTPQKSPSHVHILNWGSILSTVIPLKVLAAAVHTAW
jgi:hypothetical protein